jgi:hypothetical protein
MAKILFRSVTGDPTHQGDFGDIDGLALEFAASPAKSQALLIFNLPQPYAEGTNFPGGVFRIRFDDKAVVEGCFTYSSAKPDSFGRMPLTLTASVTLEPGKAHRADVEWAGVRGSTVHLGGSASLAAVVE